MNPAGETPIIAIVGSTGTGKSALSLDIADRLARHGRTAEVVNADAMQLYRGMDIGTAKLGVPERNGVPHHLLDLWDVTEPASVAAYQTAARAIIDDILARGSVPLLVGGSGLYVSSVLFDFRFPGTDAAVRDRLEAELASDGLAALHRRLHERDPRAAEAVGPHNARRIVRALEIIEITGNDHAASLPEDPVLWRPSRIVGLRSAREVLVPRLDERVVGMWRAGLLAEVAGLLEQGLDDGVTARRAIGYAQAIAQLRGEADESTAVAETQALTRRYARRQVSWFKRYRDVEWFDPDADAVGRSVIPAR